MTPASLCLREVDHDLDELKRADRKPSEPIVALEAVDQGIDRQSCSRLSGLARLVCTIVDGRQK